MLRNLKSAWLPAVSSSIMTAIFVTALTALASMDSSEDRVPKLIPYNGTLERDGLPYNGQTTMIFHLYYSNPGRTPSYDEVWTETQNVTVYGGRFSVMLGSASSQSQSELSTVVTSAEDIYLGITLKVGEEEIPLSDKQRFLPLPFSLWATAATNFTLNGTDLKFGPHPTRGDGGRAMVHDSSDKLVLNYAGDFTAGVKIEGNVDLPGRILSTNATKTVTLGTSDLQTTTVIYGEVYQYGDKYFACYNANEGCGMPFEPRNDDRLMIGRDYLGGIILMENTSIAGGKSLAVQSEGDCDCEWMSVDTTGTDDMSEWHCPAGKYIHAMRQEKNCGSNDNCVQSVFCCRACSFK